MSELLDLASEEGVVGQGALLEALRSDSYPSTMWNDVASSAPQWLALLNANPSSDDVIVYLLKGAKANHLSSAQILGLLEAVGSPAGLHSERKTFLAEVADGLRGDVGALANRLVYSSDAASIWHTLSFGVEQIDTEQIDGLAGRVKDSSLHRAIVVRGLQEKVLSDSTLLGLLSGGSDDLQTTVISQARRDRDLAKRLHRLAEDAPAGKAPAAAVRAELTALVLSADELDRSMRDRAWHVEAWEALTLVRPREMLFEARSLLMDDSKLRERLTAELPANLVGYAVNELKRAAAGLLVRASNDHHIDGDIESVLHWFDAVAGSGFISNEVWQVMLQLSEASLTRLPEGYFNKYADVLGFGLSIEFLDKPLGELVASGLALSERSGEREAVAVWLMNRPERTRQELTEGLHDALASVRAAACMQLTKRMELIELEALLEDYVNSEGFRWYNVIALLDSHLYSPSQGKNGRLIEPGSSD